MTFDNQKKEIGEWHEDKYHGVIKREIYQGSTAWMQYKNDKEEGYKTSNHHKGSFIYCHKKNGRPKGYMIVKDIDGNLYRGEFDNRGEKLYGHMRYANNDEYDGLWV